MGMAGMQKPTYEVIIKETMPEYFYISMKANVGSVILAAHQWLCSHGVADALWSESMGFIHAAVNRDVALLFKLTWGGAQ